MSVFCAYPEHKYDGIDLNYESSFNSTLKISSNQVPTTFTGRSTPGPSQLKIPTSARIFLTTHWLNRSLYHILSAHDTNALCN